MLAGESRRVHYHFCGSGEPDQSWLSIHYISDRLDMIYNPCKIPARPDWGASCNKQDVCWRRSQPATSPAFQLQLCAQRNLQSLLGWPELCRVLAQAAARTAGRLAGRQGSLQSLFWFPGRNKARSNVLWRARTSTGPSGGGGYS